MAAPRVPCEVAAIRSGIDAALNLPSHTGRRVGDAKYGVYAFFDYDGEPIYVGQTSERLRVRIRRHLTNQRTDAVAMNVLDPYEVADMEIWPLWDLEQRSGEDVTWRLNAAEYTVFQRAIAASEYSAVLNEKDIAPSQAIELPPSVRARIVPDEVWQLRSHPDTRIARRAATIAALARVISERDVSRGLRRTLVTQARRLEHLARARAAELGDEYPLEVPGEETGETSA